MVKDFHLFSDRKTRPYQHPVLFKNVFHASGDDWKRLRTIVSPTFTSGKMRKMFPMVRECLGDYLDVLEVYATQGRDLNVKDMYQKLTMNVIGRCAFATDANALKDTRSTFVRHAQGMTEFKFWKMLGLFVLPLPVKKLLGLKFAGNEESNQFFLNLTKQIVERRKREGNTGKVYNDFVQLLVDAEAKSGADGAAEGGPDEREGDSVEAHHVNEGKEELEVEKRTFAGNYGNKKLTIDEISAQGWIFFIAGSETTASTLGYASYELALSPHFQDRLYDEVNAAFDADGEIGYDQLSRLPFLDAVVTETLRLYPPVLRLDRKAKQDYRLADTGITISKGQDVEFPVYAIHHSELYYENADRFNPDRWMPQNRHKLIPYTYLPFGAGPRNCVGMRFGLMEVKLTLSHIIRRYRFVRSKQTAVPLQFPTVANLCVAKSVVVGIEKRFK
ncbi:unnamed protein product [Medioppia subpectinata]|uniref:Cytochrome P450 n=1 Tax=Medioppia subpectinata TaxID=1979941 RepID=A0A7R9L5E0_9ACAR|nr:unnamed protein product [Medioppia subpectinata]CAG2115653.1 unnamed protein product [Medioppia subpectinata]